MALPTVNHRFPTMLDVAKRGNNARLVVPLIDETIELAPEVGIFPVRNIPGTEYTVPMLVQVPHATFTGANEGTESVKSEYEDVKIQTFLLRQFLSCDKAVAEKDSQLLFDEARQGMEGSILTLGKQTFYGRTRNGTDAKKGFLGLNEAHDYWSEHLGKDALRVDAGGTSAGEAMSVYGVFLGPSGVQYVYGNNTVFGLTPWREETIYRNGKALDGFASHLTSWVGLGVNSRWAVSRLCNLTAQEGKGLTDKLLSDLLALCPAGRRPNYWVANKKAIKQLQDHRTAWGVNALGAKTATGVEGQAPWPTESNGIPFLETDSLSDKEAIWKAKKAA